MTLQWCYCSAERGRERDVVQKFSSWGIKAQALPVCEVCPADAVGLLQPTGWGEERSSLGGREVWIWALRATRHQLGEGRGTALSCWSARGRVLLWSYASPALREQVILKENQ